jgi:hypothetical protein
MALKRKRIIEAEDIAQELILDSDSNVHTSEEIFPLESDSGKEEIHRTHKGLMIQSLNLVHL